MRMMHYFQKFIVASFSTTLTHRNMDMEISCESIDAVVPDSFDIKL